MKIWIFQDATEEISQTICHSSWQNKIAAFYSEALQSFLSRIQTITSRSPKNSHPLWNFQYLNLKFETSPKCGFILDSNRAEVIFLNVLSVFERSCHQKEFWRYFLMQYIKIFFHISKWKVFLKGIPKKLSICLKLCLKGKIRKLKSTLISKNRH